MPSLAKANEISIRFQAARVDGTWQDLRKKLDMGEDVTSMTFEKFGQIYLSEYVKSYNRAYEDKASRIRILGRKLNPVSISVLQKSHVTSYVNWRKDMGTKNATINRDLSVLAHMLSWAVGEHYLERSLIPEIQKLREVKWAGPRPTEEIIDSVFTKLDPRVVPPFTFMRETGCRREEGLSLKHYQIDWERSGASQLGIHAAPVRQVFAGIGRQCGADLSNFRKSSAFGQLSVFYGMEF